ncbi:hypothetical protein, partial [[Ruminococcus] torques]|uniref:hypothetical protein n=1 Tax=[Ruminococcus] torques TaxID=33039 RepID=UPI003AB60F10
SNPARGWQANKRRTCAWLVILGLCPKMKNHPLGGWMFIYKIAETKKRRRKNGRGNRNGKNGDE